MTWKPPDVTIAGSILRSLVCITRNILLTLDGLNEIIRTVSPDVKPQCTGEFGVLSLTVFTEGEKIYKSAHIQTSLLPSVLKNQ